MRYLLVLAAEGPSLPQEFFCAIARIEDKNTLQFITAYNIDAKQYAQYKKVEPQYYPVLADRSEKAK